MNHSVMRPRLGVAAMLLAVALALSATASEAQKGDSGKKGDKTKSDKSKSDKPKDANGKDAIKAGDACRIKGKLIELSSNIPEASGAAFSASHGGVLWTHNDTREPVVYAVDRNGKLLGTVQIAGATATDWESIETGACGSGRCLYIADIGDNNASRSEIIVYRVAEPNPGDKTSRPAEALRARYPDGAHDAEAMYVSGQDIYIVTKGETGSTTVYKYPSGARPGAVATLQRVRVLDTGVAAKGDWVTGAAASPDGRWIALRSHGSVSFYRAADFAGAGQPAHRMDITSLKEAQGEGIAFGANGSVFLLSEGGKKGAGGTLAELQCGIE
jgi:hypothetical protein